ncbi:alpha/beta fold hydrolase [Roseomonas rosulenta]|uniref:alpha/beta fold hydrolase n=1 Tax=Roseomonas rosulenta TaxID=2748667 RepID=UPI0018DF2D55|nr:alpha/beta hydrolase [Roseomonas rosulenta]
MTIHLRDVTIAADIVGDGPPLVLLHGALGDRRTLAPVAAHLADRWRVIVPTQRHFGPAPRSVGRKPFGTASQAEDLIAMVDVLGLTRAHVVAWSFSAHSALAAALAAPERIRSLLVYEPGFPTFVTDPAARFEISADGARAFGPVVEAAQRGDWAEAARRLIDAAAGEPGWFDAQPPEVRRIHLDNADTIGLLFTQTPPVPVAAEELARLAVPTTVAWGSDTTATYRLVSQAAAQAIPGARSIAVPSAGHLLPEAAPLRFARLVAAHLEGADG